MLASFLFACHSCWSELIWKVGGVHPPSSGWRAECSPVRNSYVGSLLLRRKIYYPVGLNGCRGEFRGNYLPHKSFFITPPMCHTRTKIAPPPLAFYVFGRFGRMSDADVEKNAISCNNFAFQFAWAAGSCHSGWTEFSRLG